MENYLTVLNKCSLFNQINKDDLMKMLTCLGAKTEVFDKKYTILAEGSPAKYIGIMLSGTAQIVRLDYFGNRSIVSGLTPSDVFGESFACAEVTELPVSVIANESCEVMFINCDHILHTCSNNCTFHRQLIYNLMKSLAANNIKFHQKIEIAAKRSTREKLMTYLMAEAKNADSNSFDIPFDRQELADYLEVDRSGLSAEISKLRAEGILESRRKHFELL